MAAAGDSTLHRRVDRGGGRPKGVVRARGALAEPVRVLFPTGIRRGKGSVAHRRSANDLWRGPDVSERDSESRRVARPVAARGGRVFRGAAAGAGATGDERSR